MTESESESRSHWRKHLAKRCPTLRYPFFPGLPRVPECPSRHPERQYPTDFGAKVYKISRDAQGNQLTWLKITGGALNVRAPLTYQNAKGETVLVSGNEGKGISALLLKQMD